MFQDSIKILVVDDMAGMRRLIKKSLKELGFQNITEATNGKEAWETLESENFQFDLVISDFDMPEISGLELLKKIKGSDPSSNIPFLMITAVGQEDKVLDVLEAGVDGYIEKPFESEDLRETLVEIHSKSQ